MSYRWLISNIISLEELAWKEMFLDVQVFYLQHNPGERTLGPELMEESKPSKVPMAHRLEKVSNKLLGAYLPDNIVSIISLYTLMIPRVRTDMSGQTV